MEGSAYTVSADALKVVTDTLTANLEVIVPFGIGVTAILIGVGFIPRIIKRFTRG